MKIPNKQIRVNVTRNNIKIGKPGHCAECPIAQALIDMGYQNVNVGWENNYVCTDNAIIHFQLSRTAVNFITKFDNGEKVKPAAFVFKISRVTSFKGEI
jgi:hypothetical protein